MRAALIGPCRRRALRHPVPEAPEPAFIVFRARRHAIFGKNQLFLFFEVCTHQTLDKIAVCNGRKSPAQTPHTQTLHTRLLPHRTFTMHHAHTPDTADERQLATS